MASEPGSGTVTFGRKMADRIRKLAQSKHENRSFSNMAYQIVRDGIAVREAEHAAKDKKSGRQ